MSRNLTIGEQAFRFPFVILFKILTRTINRIFSVKCNGNCGKFSRLS